jgi:hypothetical protein
VTLSGEALPVGDFVTGLVVAAKGRAVGGRFFVEDVCAAGMPEQEAGPEGGVEGGVEGEAEGGRGREPQYVMLMSGTCAGRKRERRRDEERGEERGGGREGGREGGKRGRVKV